MNAKCNTNICINKYNKRNSFIPKSSKALYGRKLTGKRLNFV